MIEYKTGDILREDAEALVNTVNCVGVMGRGIALQFRNAFPENFRLYAVACKRDEVQPGRMFVVDTGQVMNPRYIINFPTKRHWRSKSRMEDIEAGLVALVQEIRSLDIRSIAIPPLGSGLGGLHWPDVRKRIAEALKELTDVRIVVFEPSNSPASAREHRSRSIPAMTPGRAVLVGLMDRYLRGLLDPFVTLLEVHKLMYFMQVSGESLQLRYVKGPYGPYAENLRHVLKAVEGYMISGYVDGGDMPDKQLQLVPGALSEALNVINSSTEIQERFERVSDLVEGFESPFGMELLSTVHWVVNEEPVHSIDDVIARIYVWNDRKKQFSRRQIELAFGVLSRKGWIPEKFVSRPE